MAARERERDRDAESRRKTDWMISEFGGVLKIFIAERLFKTRALRLSSPRVYRERTKWERGSDSIRARFELENPEQNFQALLHAPGAVADQQCLSHWGSVLYRTAYPSSNYGGDCFELFGI